MYARRHPPLNEYRKLSLPPFPLNNHPLDISKIDTFGFAHDDLLTPRRREEPAEDLGSARSRPRCAPLLLDVLRQDPAPVVVALHEEPDVLRVVHREVVPAVPERVRPDPVVPVRALLGRAHLEVVEVDRVGGVVAPLHIGLGELLADHHHTRDLDGARDVRGEVALPALRPVLRVLDDLLREREEFRLVERAAHHVRELDPLEEGLPVALDLLDLGLERGHVLLELGRVFPRVLLVEGRLEPPEPDPLPARRDHARNVVVGDAVGPRHLGLQLDRAPEALAPVVAAVHAPADLDRARDLVRQVLHEPVPEPVERVLPVTDLRGLVPVHVVAQGRLVLRQLRGARLLLLGELPEGLGPRADLILGGLVLPPLEHELLRARHGRRDLGHGVAPPDLADEAEEERLPLHLRVGAVVGLLRARGPVVRALLRPCLGALEERLGPLVLGGELGMVGTAERLEELPERLSLLAEVLELRLVDLGRLDLLEVALDVRELLRLLLEPEPVRGAELLRPGGLRLGLRLRRRRRVRRRGWRAGRRSGWRCGCRGGGDGAVAARGSSQHGVVLRDLLLPLLHLGVVLLLDRLEAFAEAIAKILVLLDFRRVLERARADLLQEPHAAGEVLVEEAEQPLIAEREFHGQTPSCLVLFDIF